MEKMNTLDCKTSQARFADLLLDPEFAKANPAVAAHVEACSACGAEMRELRSTMSVMDEWTAPEPTPYFDTRLYARLREAQEEAPAGFMARAKAWIAFSSSRGFGLRSAAAGALALALVIGGGTFANMHHGSTNQPAAPGSATVNDLKILDNNAQALQQMDQLLDDSDDPDNTPAT